MEVIVLSDAYQSVKQTKQLFNINDAKGHLISEGNFGVFKSPEKLTFFGFMPKSLNWV